MKRIGFILSMVMMITLGFSSMAYAEDWKTSGYPKVHYGFSVATESCAGCHITHTATAAKLLSNGRTQTEFCLSCHGTLLGSPYDVETGVIKENGSANTSPSTAGKFGFLSGDVTSSHTVDTPAVNSAAIAANAIPGNDLGNGNNGFPNGFKCGSCHDVHAGDQPNDRLLKNRIWAVQPALANVVNFVYDGTKLTVTKYAETPEEVDAINGYCGLCHSRFNLVDDAGKQVVNNVYQNVAGSTYYRHALGVSITAGSSPTLAPYLGNPDPGSSADGKNVVLCLTCHFAHGTTTVANDVQSTWKRDGDVAPAVGGPSSVLLRMDKRGVCYDCHGAATKNTESFGQTNN